MNPSPMYFNLCKEIIIYKIENNIQKFINNIKITKRDKKYLEEELSNVYICPSCGGSGTIIKVQYHREGRHVTSIKHPQECLLCKGKGKIK